MQMWIYNIRIHVHVFCLESCSFDGSSFCMLDREYNSSSINELELNSTQLYIGRSPRST